LERAAAKSPHAPTGIEINMEKKMVRTKNFKRGVLALLLTLALGLSACAAGAPTQIGGAIALADGRGRTVTLAAPAQRIVSLAPSNTEILYAVGAGDRLVGRDAFSDYPEEAKAVTDIGGGFGELNMEVILTQKPDLVLASSLTPEEQVKALEDAGITVFALSNPKDFDGMYANLRSMAALTGQQATAETLIASLQQRVATVDAKLSGVADRPLVFYEIDGTDINAVYTPGPDSYIHKLIIRAGGENIAADLTGEWPKINLEALIARQPEIILLGDAYWGGVTVEAVAARAGWDALKAVQEGHVYPFDDNLVSRPGPRMVDGLEALAKLFHPELFK
jgi:iron complex transport system substrate-binding protein